MEELKPFASGTHTKAADWVPRNQDAFKVEKLGCCEFMVSLGQGKVSGHSNVKGSAKGEVLYQGPPATTYALRYEGPDAPRFFWVQFVWRREKIFYVDGQMLPVTGVREAQLPPLPVRNPERYRLVTKQRPYRLTPHGSSPTAAHLGVDSYQIEVPAYVGIRNRTDKEITIFDSPSPSADWEAANNNAKIRSVRSTFRARAFLIERTAGNNLVFLGKVVYQARVKLTWVMRTRFHPQKYKHTIRCRIEGVRCEVAKSPYRQRYTAEFPTFKIQGLSLG